MKRHFYLLASAALLALAVACGGSSASLGAFKVEITNMAGNPVSNAKLYLALVDASGKAAAAAEVTTDASGAGVFQDLPLGEYTARIRDGGRNECSFTVNVKDFTGPNRGKTAGSCVFQ